MSWYKDLLTFRPTKLESRLREWFNIPLSAYKQWQRRLHKKHRWFFELLSSIFFLPLVLVFIAIGALGLLEVATRSSENGRGVIYPYYSKYWDAIGGIANFNKEGFYEFIYWTAGALLLYGLLLLHSIVKKDRDSAYVDGQPTASEPMPDPEGMKEIDLLKEVNDIMHVLYEVYPRPLEDWAGEIADASDPSANFVLWRRIANVYKKLAENHDSLHRKETMFWALLLYVEGTKRPGKVVRLLKKDGKEISPENVREIIAEYEAERDRLFLRV